MAFGLIWVCEKRKAWQDMLTTELVDEFSVQLFSSESALGRAWELYPGRRPELVVVDSDELSTPARLLRGEAFSTLPRWLFLSRGYPSECAGPQAEPQGLSWRLSRQSAGSLLRQAVGRLLLAGCSAAAGGGEAYRVSTRPPVIPRPDGPSPIGPGRGSVVARGQSALAHDDELACDCLSAAEGGSPRPLLRFASLALDCNNLELQLFPDTPAESLSPKEARLLRVFMQSPSVCLPRAEIQKAVWGGVRVSPRTVDSQISRLRKRLEPAGVSIENVYRGGYILR